MKRSGEEREERDMGWRDKLLEGLLDCLPECRSVCMLDGCVMHMPVYVMLAGEHHNQAQSRGRYVAMI
jgi:hypothetical protein